MSDPREDRDRRLDAYAEESEKWTSGFYDPDYDEPEERQHAADIRSIRAESKRLREAVDKLSYCLLPSQMAMAEAELVEDPVPDGYVVLSFMGSGASARTTAGEVREAMSLARAALSTPPEEGR